MSDLRWMDIKVVVDARIRRDGENIVADYIRVETVPHDMNKETALLLRGAAENLETRPEVEFARAMGASVCEPCNAFFPSRRPVCSECGRPTIPSYTTPQGVVT